MRVSGMTHLNGAVLCAIDIDTTGHDPFKHEIISFAIIPLDHRLNVSEEVMPLEILIKPELNYTYDPDNLQAAGNTYLVKRRGLKKKLLIEAEARGTDKYDAQYLFDLWYKSLELKDNKRIMPLGHDWLTDSMFIMSWLGLEHYYSYFDTRYRDVLTLALGLDDMAYRHRFGTVPYPKVKLEYLCRILKINADHMHTTIEDAHAIAQVYKAMLAFGLGDGRPQNELSDAMIRDINLSQIVSKLGLEPDDDDKGL